MTINFFDPSLADTKALSTSRFYRTVLLIAIFCALAVHPVFAAKTSIVESSAGAELSDISLLATDGIRLSPPFSSKQKRYKVFVNSDIANVVIKAIVASPQGHLKINNTDVVSGEDYSAKLETGKNQFKLEGIDSKGLSKEYMLTIIRENIQPVVDKFQELTYTDIETNTNMSYRLFTPVNYNPAQAYPLVLFLHGSGESGTDNEAQLIANQGATIWAKPEEQAKHPCFVLAPQARDTWTDDSVATNNPREDLEMAVKVLHRVIESYDIDKSRLYATGVSDGGFGVWALNEIYPDLFAAMVPVCGGGDPAQAYKLVNKPIWAFQGEGDPIVSVKYNRNMISALRDVGATPLYTEYPRETYIYPMAHYSWVLAYQTQEMRDWLFAQVKK